MGDKITLIIADDHPIFRRGLRQLIEREADVEVLDEAGEGEAGLAAIVRHRPDVAVLDIDMPRLNGLGVLRALRDRVCSFLSAGRLIPFPSLRADRPPQSRPQNTPQ